MNVKNVRQVKLINNQVDILVNLVVLQTVIGAIIITDRLGHIRALRVILALSYQAESAQNVLMVSTDLIVNNVELDAKLVQMPILVLPV